MRNVRKVEKVAGVEKKGFFRGFKIVTIIRIVISGSQTSFHSQDILTLDRESRKG